MSDDARFFRDLGIAPTDIPEPEPAMMSQEEAEALKCTAEKLSRVCAEEEKFAAATEEANRRRWQFERHIREKAETLALDWRQRAQAWELEALRAQANVRSLSRENKWLALTVITLAVGLLFAVVAR